MLEKERRRIVGLEASGFLYEVGRICEFGVRLECEWLAYEHSVKRPSGDVGPESRS